VRQYVPFEALAGRRVARHLSTPCGGIVGTPSVPDYDQACRCLSREGGDECPGWCVQHWPGTSFYASCYFDANLTS
jgi:hypothetical protein